MCPRNSYGGPERSHVANTEITLEQIKKWFTPEFLQKVSYIYACGNNGDPLMARDCLEIFKYFREHCKPNTTLAIHTNGSLRNTEWWVELAKIIGKDGFVVFAIDGWKGEHELYRRGTFWDKIIDNAKAFIGAGGEARADTLVFRHNEQRIYELRDYLLGLGFSQVNLKATQRFYGIDQYPVKNKDDEIEYYLSPAMHEEWNIKMPKPNYVRLYDKNEFDIMLKSAIVDPSCSKGSTLYINTFGKVYPCCWVGSLVENSDTFIADYKERAVRNRLMQSAHDLMADIGMIDLNGSDMLTEISKVDWNGSIGKHWTTDPKFTCVKSCGTNFAEIISK